MTEIAIHEDNEEKTHEAMNEKQMCRGRVKRAQIIT